jgi:DNA-directed RNA polymerase beta' subunit
MIDKGLSPWDVARAIQNHVGVHGIVCASEYNMPNWIIRLRLTHVAGMIKKAQRDIGNHMIEDMERALVTKIQNTLLQEVAVSGVRGIKKAIPTEIQETRWNEDGSKKNHKEWIVETEGSTLLDLLGLPYVDATRTYSNDIPEVASVLGIEAAAGVLYNESKIVISFDRTYVNDRHFMHLVNTMTFRGHLVAISRHGFGKIDNRFLVRSSFEEPVDSLFEAACFAEKNNVGKGAITENIILGQLAPMGTGACDMLVDRDYQDQRWKSENGQSQMSVEPQIVTTFVRPNLDSDTDDILDCIATSEVKVSDPAYPQVEHPHYTRSERRNLEEAQYRPSSPPRDWQRPTQNLFQTPGQINMDVLRALVDSLAPHRQT